jgi:hypothetical protein
VLPLGSVRTARIIHKLLQMMRPYVVCCTLLCFFSSLWELPLLAQVTVEQIGTRWTLLVDGQPFPIKGATFGYVDSVTNYDRYFQDLTFLGVNTIRTWGTDENTPQLLDAAETHGIKVMLGIWLRHGRPGMEDDDQFNYLVDTAGMAVMYANAIQTVEDYKDHPAVLTWGVANEVYLNTATDAEKEAYSMFLEKVCQEIKRLDPQHPITSVEAWTFGLSWWEKFVPSIDIYGLNSYGPAANFLAGELAKRGIDKPYIVTEFGVMGEWDVAEDQNGVKVEPSDAQKYEAIVKGYHQWIKNKPACLGVYVFHYGDGEEFVAPWLLTHYRGLHRPQYWAIREAYTGAKPLDEVPTIEVFSLPNTTMASGSWVPVTLQVIDVEQAPLQLSFYYNQRTGSRKRRNQLLPLRSRGNLKDGFEVQLPQEHGAVKVYVNVEDSYPNVGVATTSIMVADEGAARRKYLVPRVAFPFYLYTDEAALPYFPSGYMGNYEAMAVDLAHEEDVYEGATAIKISYSAREGWYGLAFVDPPNDWGDILGGYDLTGARTLSFWAKTGNSTLKATVGYGLIEGDKPYPDTDKQSVEIELTEEWQQYIIKIRRADLGCIRSGFVIFSSANGFPHDIYLDRIVYE